MKQLLYIGLVAVLISSLTACGDKPEDAIMEIPGKQGDRECYEKSGDEFALVGKANRVEDCAGMLDAIFTQSGKKKLIGAYQGAKLIIADTGVFVSVNGSVAFPLLTRTPDGMLVPPSQAPVE